MYSHTTTTTSSHILLICAKSINKLTPSTEKQEIKVLPHFSVTIGKLCLKALKTKEKQNKIREK